MPSLAAFDELFADDLYEKVRVVGGRRVVAFAERFGALEDDHGVS